jgi:hypothetical protein
MATSGPTDTIARGSERMSQPVAAGAKINQGALVVLTAAGLAAPASTALNLRAAGRAEETVDNTGGAAAAKSIEIRRGQFKFKNAGADPVTQADVLGDCYIVDDDTVARTNGANTRSRAGTVINVEPSGVWVEIG